MSNGNCQKHVLNGWFDGNESMNREHREVDHSKKPKCLHSKDLPSSFCNSALAGTGVGFLVFARNATITSSAFRLPMWNASSSESVRAFFPYLARINTKRKTRLTY